MAGAYGIALRTAAGKGLAGAELGGVAAQPATSAASPAIANHALSFAMPRTRHADAI
jgi:hypothetical protein